MTKARSYFWIWRSQNLVLTVRGLYSPLISCWYFQDILSLFVWVLLLSCCLSCNFPLLLIPPLSTDHHRQFVFIPLPLTFLSVSAPRSPCLTASTCHHLFPRHHHVFIITPQPSLCRLHSPLILVIHLRISVTVPPLFTHLHPLIPPQPSWAC